MKGLKVKMKIYQILYKSRYGEIEESGEIFVAAQKGETAKNIALEELTGKEVLDIDDAWGGDWLYRVYGHIYMGQSEEVGQGVISKSKALQLVGYKPRTLKDYIEIYPVMEYKGLNDLVLAVLEIWRFRTENKM